MATYGKNMLQMSENDEENINKMGLPRVEKESKKSLWDRLSI